MRDRLQRRFLVRKEVARQGSYEGEIALAELPRLAELIDTDCAADQKAQVKFDFSLDEFDSQQLTGSLETCLTMQCQRCLEPMEFPVAVSFGVLIDADEHMERASGKDSVSSDEGYLDVFELVEDEIILSIPLITAHENQDCNEHWPDSVDENVERENPFAVLKGLKT